MTSKRSESGNSGQGFGNGARDRPSDGVEAQMQALQGIREEDTGNAGRHATSRSNGEVRHRSGDAATRPADD